MDSSDILTLILQLMAWVRLSELERIPVELSYSPSNPPRDIKEIAAIFSALSRIPYLDDNGAAFNYLSGPALHIKPAQLLQILEALSSNSLKAPWGAVDLADFISTSVSGREFGFLGVPRELADLMVALALPDENLSIYIPFETLFQLTFRVQQYSRNTFSETKYVNPLPWLLCILSDVPADIRLGDELLKPSYLLDGRLVRFDTCLAFPPFGVKVSEEIAERDPYGRFPEKTTSFTILAIRHVIATTKGRAIIAVPNSLLFGRGAEHLLRQSLIHSGLVEGVIALPPALLPSTGISMSLLVLNMDRHQQNILFLDGANQEFFSKDGKGRSLLHGWNTLRDIFLSREEGLFSRLVSTNEVLANDAYFQVSRYCLSPELNAFEKLLAKYETKSLDELVRFIRPFPLADKDGEVLVDEVGPSDFPEYGYVKGPGKAIKTSLENLQKGNKHYLKGGDIIIALKGSVGKVAIVHEYSISSPLVAGQSCMILRVTNPGIIDSRALFMFLKSEAGQLLLKQIVSSGSTVPIIQLRALEKVSIPIPSKEEQEKVIAAFEEIQSMEKHVQELRNNQRKVSKQYWAIKDEQTL
jgi:type I restriction enzyme M protein